MTEKPTMGDRLIELAFVRIACYWLARMDRTRSRWGRMVCLAMYPLWFFASSPVWLPIAILAFATIMVEDAWRDRP